MQRVFMSLGLVALAVVSMACSGAAAAPPSSQPPSGEPAGDAIRIVATNLAFQPATLTVEAGKPLEIVLDNQDEAPHNIAIKDAAGTTGFKGEIVTKGEVTNLVPALTAGTYTFWCEVHPEMQGTITAE